MTPENIFNWISEQRLKTAFLKWWEARFPEDNVPSYRTIMRTEKCIDAGKRLSKPQKLAVRRAEEFQLSRNKQSQAA
jgi:hypothetical protein